MTVAAGMAAAGALVQGIGGMVAGQRNKRSAYAQAAEELRASQADERALREEARKAIGEQLAGQFSNGLLGGTGSALDALRESQINAALDARELRRQGVGRARALRRQGKDAATQGYFDLASGLLGAGASAGRQRSDWAQARVGSGSGGASGGGG